MASKKILDAAVEGKTKKSLAEKVVKSQSAKNKSYTIDLRVHSPESLGYMAVEGLKAAPALVRLAKVKGIDLLGITDLFGSDFIDEVKEAAAATAISIIPGVDLRCRLADCDDLILSVFFQEDWGSSEVRKFLDRLEIASGNGSTDRPVVQQSFSELMAIIEEFGGFALPSRIDKTPARLKILPVLIEQYGFRTFEVAYPEDAKEHFKRRWPKLKFKLFTFSNANALAQVGSRPETVKLPLGGFAGLKSMHARDLVL